MFELNSCDIVGRVKTYESIVKGQNVSEPGVPESFKVLIKELQALCLDIRVLNDENQEISIKDITEDEADTYEVPTKKVKHFENGKLIMEEEIDLDAFDDVDLDDDEPEDTSADSGSDELDVDALFGDDDVKFDDKFADSEPEDDLDDLDDLLIPEDESGASDDKADDKADDNDEKEGE